MLGAGIHSDGEPTLNSRWRVIRSVQLYNEGRVPLLLFATGITNGEKTEAGAMARYARSLGVPEKAILLEEQSTNTEENAQFASEMLRARASGKSFSSPTRSTCGGGWTASGSMEFARCRRPPLIGTGTN